MAVDDLVAQGARASAAVVLTLFSDIITSGGNTHMILMYVDLYAKREYLRYGLIIISHSMLQGVLLLTYYCGYCFCHTNARILISDTISFM